ncbi:hypothetical protein [Moorella sp. E308F]|uniref:hypothetical protein n=1 Tax=Moorella sp. E308F TaxID=2572682 RepID=UPI001C0EB52A|nr:hypothetical protein [Moorella sp. E308F]
MTNCRDSNKIDMNGLTDLIQELREWKAAEEEWRKVWMPSSTRLSPAPGVGAI